MYTVYLGKPMSGHLYEWVKEYLLPKSDALKKAGCRVIHPLTGKPYFKADEVFKKSGYTQFPPSTDHAICNKDYWGVSISDIVLMDLSGVDKISIGCVSEMAWAYALRKIIVLVMEPGNIHEHAMINHEQSIRYHTIEEAMDYLLKLVKTEI